MAGDPGVRAGILVTGTEVISGQISDRNGPWIAERLGELGVEVAHILSVGDRPDDLEAALRFLAGEGMALTVTSGGLGPTADDLTAEIVARFAGRELALDAEMEEKIARILAGFARRFHLDPDGIRAANRKQAMVPHGAAVIDPAGTAPGLVVPGESMTVIVLPGPPRELQEMWPAAIATPEARAVLDRAEELWTRTLRLFGVPESELALSLREIEAGLDLSELEITTCLRRAELVIDIRHRPGAEDPVERLAGEIKARHGPYLFSEDGTTIDDQLAELLRGRRLGLAESCTGGLLAARITERPGSSDYLVGSVVAYANQSKTELLAVPEELIAAHGAVSPEVAEAMAAGALERFGADVACSITGVAGPGGGTEEKPVGYVCVSAKLAGGATLTRDPTLPGNRTEIRDRSTGVAMHLLRRLLRGEETPA